MIVINISQVSVANECDVLMTICNVCWKEPGVISKPCGGIYLTPFPILKIIYLQNIIIQVKT